MMNFIEQNMKYLFIGAIIFIIWSIIYFNFYQEVTIIYLDKGQLKTLMIAKKDFTTSESVIDQTKDAPIEKNVNCNYSGICFGRDLGTMNYSLGFHTFCDGHKFVKTQIIHEQFVEKYSVTKNNFKMVYTSPIKTKMYETHVQDLSSCK